jgi:hypothetical protein
MATDAERNRGAGAYSTPGVDQSAHGQPSPIYSSSPIVTFKLSQIEPPSAEYLAPGDMLSVVVTNSDPAVTSINVLARIIRAADGQLSFSQWTLAVNSSRVVASKLFPLPEGYLLSIHAIGNAGTNRGRCFIECAIQRSNVGGFPEFVQLVSDYLSRQHDPAWPVGSYIHSVDGRGFPRSVVGTTPGAGAEITETVPTGARWRLSSIRFRLATSAAVANRSVQLIIDDGANPVWIGGFNFVQAASLIEDYGPGIGASPVIDASGVVATTALPDMLMFAGWRWRTRSTNLQAADQYSAVQYNAEEWIEL